jgi:tyrosyl-tRNA synthetase
MGKTAQGAVWLNADMFSPWDFWQYWRNTEDADVGRFLRLFTVLPMDEIRRLETLQGSDINEAKKVLATEATALLHGRDEAERAQETARQTFEEGGAADDLPTVETAGALAGDGAGLLGLIVKAGLAASNGEARRHVQGGAVRINDAPVTDERRMVTLADCSASGAVKLSLGRKKHVLLKP